MRAFTFALLLAFIGSNAFGAEPASIEVAGAVQTPGAVILTKLPASTVTVDQVTSGKPFQGTFTGPLLWDVLAQAKVIDTGRGSLLQRTVTLTAKDGYVVVLSYSEISPEYGNNGAIVAVNGNELPRVILPKDRRASRDVRDLVKIEVK